MAFSTEPGHTWPRHFELNNPRSSDEWTVERIKLLLKLDAENQLSRSQIAHRLKTETGSCFSRNAIIGKLSRLGAPPKERKLTTHKSDYEVLKRIKLPAKLPLPQRPKAVLQESLRLSLIDLEPNQCRYVTSQENEPFAFCGHPMSAKSYCAAHYDLCYRDERDPRPDARLRMIKMNSRRIHCEAA